MDSLTFTIKLKDLDACDGDFDQVVKAIQNFINILHCASPDYYLAGDVLQKQLDEQVKKHKEETGTLAYKIRLKWDKIFDEAKLGFTYWDMHERHGDEPVPGYFDAWDNFYHQIGEAMGPVCYAGYKLKMKFIEAGQYADWVDECIDYYEKNWEF